jgi:hypothetical protein
LLYKKPSQRRRSWRRARFNRLRSEQTPINLKRQLSHNYFKRTPCIFVRFK